MPQSLPSVNLLFKCQISVPAYSYLIHTAQTQPFSYHQSPLQPKSWAVFDIYTYICSQVSKLGTKLLGVSVLLCMVLTSKGKNIETILPFCSNQDIFPAIIGLYNQNMPLASIPTCIRFRMIRLPDFHVYFIFCNCGFSKFHPLPYFLAQGSRLTKFINFWVKRILSLISSHWEILYEEISTWEAW